MTHGEGCDLCEFSGLGLSAFLGEYILFMNPSF